VGTGRIGKHGWTGLAARQAGALERAVSFRETASSRVYITMHAAINTHAHFEWHVIALSDLGVRIDWPLQPFNY
jgi:hypothetical protein